MIRRTITTMTLAAVATITLATAAPAMAAAPSDSVEPLTEHIGGGTCTLETAFGSIPCPDFDWSLGGLSGSEAESDESTAVGGVVSDAPIEVVTPGDLLADAFTPRIDLIPSPTVSAEEDGDATSVGDGLVEVVTPTPGGLSDALDAVRTSPTPDSSEPVVPTEEPSDGNATTEVVEPSSDASPDVVEPASAPVTTVPQITTTTVTVGVAQAPTTTVANTALTNDESRDVQALPHGPDATNDIDPAAATLVGVLGTLAVAGLGFGAYKFGQRGQ
jgi:hypothetical protein